MLSHFSISVNSPSGIHPTTSLTDRNTFGARTERTARNRNILSGLLNDNKPSEGHDYTGDHDGGSLESTTNVGTTRGTLVRIKREEAELGEEAGLVE
jgi:hypothetical protein